MEISVLQSLIDSTSNEITGHESSIQFDNHALSSGGVPPWETDLLYFSISWHKQRLPKLRKIQKELKKEIAKEIKKAAQQRVVDAKLELDGKIGKLDEFIMRSETYLELSGKEQLRLCKQFDAMEEYSYILGERINAFGEGE